MADHAVEEDDGDIFIYRGGRAQHDVTITHVLIDKSADEIEDNAFYGCRNLVQVDTHDGLRRVGMNAFRDCESLRRINLKSAVEIDAWAFDNCENLESVEFGDRLEIIGHSAFGHCALKHLKLPSIITVGVDAFYDCECLTDIELSERLESIGSEAFWNCERLQRIAVPLKRDLFVYDDDEDGYTQFDECVQLASVDIVGGIHETIASLHMESCVTPQACHNLCYYSSEAYLPITITSVRSASSHFIHLHTLCSTSTRKVLALVDKHNNLSTSIN